MSNTWIELDLNLLGENIRHVRKAVGAGTEIVFAVKSDAYGHGMVPVAAHARKCGVRWFAVSHMDEAVRLRQALPDAAIIVLGVIGPDAVPEVMARNIIPIVADEEHGCALAAAASARKQVLRCHVKVDTGMGRLGIPCEGAAESIRRLSRKPGLELAGLCSHFASSDAQDRTFPNLQAERFFAVAAQCEAMGIALPFKHISNSGALLSEPRWNCNAVRPGILLYGYRPGTRPAAPDAAAGQHHPVDTRPFLQWKTRVIQVKKALPGTTVGYDSTYVANAPTHLAVLDAGYADGYSRALSNKARVVVRGRCVPVVGRISMNFITVDAGPTPDVQRGDEVVLIGRQGDATVWADDLARLSNTIPYEVLTSIKTADRREYRGNGVSE